jgi:hypothetical protein
VLLASVWDDSPLKKKKKHDSRLRENRVRSCFLFAQKVTSYPNDDHIHHYILIIPHYNHSWYRS